MVPLSILVANNFEGPLIVILLSFNFIIIILFLILYFIIKSIFLLIYFFHFLLHFFNCVDIVLSSLFFSFDRVFEKFHSLLPRLVSALQLLILIIVKQLNFSLEFGFLNLSDLVFFVLNLLLAFGVTAHV